MTRSIRITERDQALLGHIKKYRITTVAVATKEFFAGSESAARTCLRRLREAGYIDSQPLYGLPTGATCRCYYLTRLALRKLYGEPAKREPFLGEQALVQRFGILAFCFLGEKKRRIASRDELGGRFLELHPTWDYYLDEDEEGRVRLGVVLVDHGGDYQRRVKKYRSVLQYHYQREEFRALLRPRDGEGMVISIVTTSEQKAAQVEEALERALLQTELTVFFRVEPVPELSRVLDHVQ